MGGNPVHQRLRLARGEGVWLYIDHQGDVKTVCGRPKHEDGMKRPAVAQTKTPIFEPQRTEGKA